MPVLTTDCEGHGEYKVLSSALRQCVEGVSVVAKTCEHSAKPVVEWISSCRTSDADTQDDTAVGTSLRGWQDVISSMEVKEHRQLAGLALSIAFLREKTRTAAVVIAADISLVWSLIHSALTSQLFAQCNAYHTTKGFWVIPLCILAKDNVSLEFFRLHVWLPNEQRGDPRFSICSHSAFFKSWVLVGEVKYQAYKVEPASDQTAATHAEHTLDHSTTHELPETCCTVVNTGALVQATASGVASYTTGMSCEIPEALFHTTEIADDALHADIVFVDSRGEAVKATRFLGPKDAGSLSTMQLSDYGDIVPATLASMVEAVRSWDSFMSQGKQHIAHAELEYALRAFHDALNICSSIEQFPNAAGYRHNVLGMLGYTNRLFGRYTKAKEILEGALSEMGPTMERVSISGELGIIYRHMDRIEDAKRAFEVQYETAKQLRFERAMCRAIGNLGMVNYQLSQRKNHENQEALLELAIAQLTERIQIARYIKEVDVPSSRYDPVTTLLRRKQAVGWEIIGLARLSLCYAASSNLKEAITVSSQALALAHTLEDSTVLALSRFFHGRALLQEGHRERALEEFNPTAAKCTPAIALCKEPSEEHRQYLRELLDAGADMDLVDEHGYSALDYAVFAGDAAAEAIVLEGLRRANGYRGAADNLAGRRAEALLRKGYRELFQEKLRPVLLGGGDDKLQTLRRVYADALAEDENRRLMFDGLKYMRYSDFCSFGRLPRSSDGLVRRFTGGFGATRLDDVMEFIIFFSYRWIGNAVGVTSPDDNQNTQYRRMIQATEKFLRLYPSVDRETLGIWMVSLIT
jgi:tetratricopeptide (TPR) repeat protein